MSRMEGGRHTSRINDLANGGRGGGDGMGMWSSDDKLSAMNGQLMRGQEIVPRGLKPSGSLEGLNVRAEARTLQNKGLIRGSPEAQSVEKQVLHYAQDDNIP